MTDYNMSSGVGRTYKYYTGTPLWPFGYGKSYASFALEGCKKSTLRGGGVKSGTQTVGCDVRHTGGPDGDEVLLAFHSIDDALRATLDHPVPKRELVDFTRVSVAAGGVTHVSFELPKANFTLVDNQGVRQLYSGRHYVTISRGVGNDDDATLTFDL